MAARRGTKASRSAAAKKAAATRKRNAAKRSAAAKKAAATRKRNARRGSSKRKASTTRRSTKASRSAAAKKAAATRRRNQAKRSRAAKKAAATRKRNARGSSKRKASTTRRSTKASRSAAAKKAWRTRRRNAAKRSSAAKRGASKRRSSSKRKASSKRRSTKASRSAAAKKAWRTRRRNGNAKRRTARRRKARSATATAKNLGKSLSDAMMNGAQMIPAAAGVVAATFVAFGAYEALRPLAWDRINLTGPTGMISQAANMLPGTANTSADIANFAEKSLGLATIGGIAFLASSKKSGLGLIDTKIAKNAMYAASIVYTVNFLSEIQTANLGQFFTNLSKGNFGNAKNALLSGGLGNTHHNLNVSNTAGTGMMHMNGMHMNGAHNYSMGTASATNQLQTANTAAIQRGTGASAFFGTKGLGSARVNLF